MRALLVETLREVGQEPTVDDVGAVTASQEEPGGTHLVLNTHIDTVGPHVPYERDGDVVRGRGACDAKGPLAALLSASVGNGRLTLAVSPDEETSQFGGEHLAATLSADGYIVGEPTGLDVCHAARGSFGGRVSLRGESAHASDPDPGTNPLRSVGVLIEALEQYDQSRGPGEHPVLGAPTLTPTLVESDGPLNQIPAECTVSFDRRTVPPETAEGFFTDLESFLEDRLGGVAFDVTPAYPDSPDPEGFAPDPDTDLVRTLADAAGGSVRTFGAATEASYFAADAPTVVFGPDVIADESGPVAHSIREYVSRSEVAVAAEAVRETAETLLD